MSELYAIVSAIIPQHTKTVIHGLTSELNRMHYFGDALIPDWYVKVDNDSCGDNGPCMNLDGKSQDEIFETMKELSRERNLPMRLLKCDMYGSVSIVDYFSPMDLS